MSSIKTYKKGEFSQINLDNGDKILLSYGKTDMKLFELGFLSIPKGTLHTFSNKFLYELTQKIGYDMSKDIVKILADKIVRANSLREAKEICLTLEKDKKFIEKV